MYTPISGFYLQWSGLLSRLRAGFSHSRYGAETMTTAVKLPTETPRDGSKVVSQPGMSIRDGMEPGIIVLSAIKSYSSPTTRSSGPNKLARLRF